MMMRSLADPKVCASLKRRLDKLTPSTPPQWGVMSSLQMLRHLAAAFEMALGDCLVVDRPERRLDNRIMRFISVTLPLRWPRGVPTIPETDIAAHPSITQSVASFAGQRDALVALIARFSQAKAGDLRPKHPLLGPFSHDQWMRWGFRHTDHHLRQFGC